MRWKLVALVIVPCFLQTGCSMYGAIARNSVAVPMIETDDCMIEKHSRMMAQAVWREVVAKSDEPYSCEYKDGFIEGFADYLVRGGTGEPPAVPPFRYLLVHDQNPPGREANEQWFAGWRHGSSLAIRSGQREFITVPLSTVWPADPYRRTYPERPRGPAPAESELLPSPHEDLPEELPVPRVVPDQPQPGEAALIPRSASGDAVGGKSVPELLPTGFSSATPVLSTEGRPGEPSRGLLYRWLKPGPGSDAVIETGPVVLPRQP